MFRIFLFSILIALAVSCKKQELRKYTEPDALAFYRNVNGELDSIIYSFSTTGAGKQVDTILLKMRVVGVASSSPRTVRLRAADGSNAIPGTDYKLLDYTLPAGALSFTYPLVVYKTVAMKTQSYRLVLESETAGAFPGIVPEGPDITNTTVSLKQMKIDITDRIVQPAYWNNIASYFGAYSNTKYNFMIQSAGSGDFRPVSLGGIWTTNNYLNAAIKLRNELIVYEAANGPLIDENGNRVTF